MATITLGIGGNWTDGLSWIGGAAPTAADDAITDGLSGNVTVDLGAVCRSWQPHAGYTGTMSGSFVLSIGDGTAGAGNIALKLVSGMTLTYNGAFAFVSTSGTQQSVTTAGLTPAGITFNGAGGSWILADNLTLTSTGNFTLTAGSLDTGGKTISCQSFISSNSNVRSLTLGSSQITCTGTGDGSTNWLFTTVTNLTFSGASSTIILSATNTGTRTFAGGGKTYGTLQIATGNAGIVLFTGSNTFSKITVTGGSTKTLKFTAGTTTTITTAGADGLPSGAASNLITYVSSSNGSAWNLSKSSGSVVCDYISLQDSAAAGGATFTPGLNSTNVSGNSGWGFPSGPPLGTAAMMGVGK